MSPAGAAEIVELAAADLALRDRLVAEGALFDGYHPEMRALHEANARRLLALAEAEGWPGGDAADAAWLVAQHAIGLPDVQRRFLALIEAAAATGGAPAKQAAMLADRIAVNEGRAQRYGTQFDWDADGRMSPLPIEDADGVDARRAALGLEPLAERIATMRARAEAEGDRPPADLAARRAAMDAWARSVGWR